MPTLRRPWLAVFVLRSFTPSLSSAAICCPSGKVHHSSFLRQVVEVQWAISIITEIVTGAAVQLSERAERNLAEWTRSIVTEIATEGHGRDVGTTRGLARSESSVTTRACDAIIFIIATP